MQSTALGGLGACPQGNFEKLHLQRLNLGHFSNLSTFDIPVDTGIQNFLKCIICMPIHARAVGTIAAMAATLFSSYLTCDIQNALIKLAALQYMFLWPCFLVIIASLSCYSMRDAMGLVARSIIKIIITGALS